MAGSEIAECELWSARIERDISRCTLPFFSAGLGTVCRVPRKRSAGYLRRGFVPQVGTTAPRVARLAGADFGTEAASRQSC